MISLIPSDSIFAKNAGIVMPETYLFPSKTGYGHFGVKRFDRIGNQKIHIHSACGLLNADFRVASLDYASLLKLTKLLTKNNQDVEQMVRLMIFNVKAGNKDDHSKNFSFMLDENKNWKWAPGHPGHSGWAPHSREASSEQLPPHPASPGLQDNPGYRRLYPGSP